MQDYTNSLATATLTKNIEDFYNTKTASNSKALKNADNAEINTKFKKEKFKDNKDVKEYLKNSKISLQWCQDTDSKLYLLALDFVKLIHHPHFKVRLELCNMCELIINTCLM